MIFNNGAENGPPTVTGVIISVGRALTDTELPAPRYDNYR